MRGNLVEQEEEVVAYGVVVGPVPLAFFFFVVVIGQKPLTPLRFEGEEDSYLLTFVGIAAVGERSTEEVVVG